MSNGFFSCLAKWAKVDCFRVMLKDFETNKLYLYVAVHLFSNRSQRTSKCGKNIHLMTHLAIGLCTTFLFLPHFDVICDLLLNRRTATWNLFVELTTE